MSGTEDAEASRRNYKKPHSGRNPIPTVQQYRGFKEEQRAELGSAGQQAAPSQNDSQITPGEKGAWSEAVQDWWHGDNKEAAQDSAAKDDGQDQGRGDADQRPADDDDVRQSGEERATAQDTSQTGPTQSASDPRQKRKQMKNTDTNRAEREVTDPVTHLPVTIHDYTGKDLDKVANEKRDDNGDGIDGGEDDQVDMQGVQQQGRTRSELQKADSAQKREHGALYNCFPPPRYDELRVELARVQKRAALFVLVPTVAFVLLMLAVEIVVPDRIITLNHRINARYVLVGETLLTVIFFSLAIGAVQGWAQKQAECIWDDAVWHAKQVEARKAIQQGPQETTLWLSKLIGSIWPLVNPDLFNSLADTLEDVMQASLSGIARMVSVEDIGQGSEPLRILGVKWLPKGAAGKSMDNVEKQDQDSKQQNNGQMKGGANSQDYDDTSKDDKVATQDSNEGMGAEEGEFVNVEIAFAYRASQFQKKLKDRQKNAHLLLTFYLFGNIKLPLWVELRGIVGSCRARLQLTPDPPFVALCTLTLLGQPKVDLRCVPLVKQGVNIMDLPVFSNFVQSSVDAALSEYVAPKSIPVDLQAMLAGDDFKKDTSARGVLVCRIKRAYDFKASDMAMPIIGKERSSDAYVSVGWAKFGKPLWSTRIIMADMQPYWEETAYLLVTPEELDAEESLRVQLWDSDKFSADDDLGRIELVLKDIMRDGRTNGNMVNRTDSFKALEVGKGMPGTLEWSVGYYSKVRLLESQISQQVKDKGIESIDQLKEQVYKTAEKKLRETAKNESSELQQLKEDDWENQQINMITSSVPSDEYPSGILSIKVHQIVGLSVENTRKNKSPEEEEHGAVDDHDSLPDSYCTIIINDQKIFKTRTKPKNSAPFFNACTERFIRDWRSTTVMLAVRDQRVHEDHAFLGHIFLDIGEMFLRQKTSRVNSFWPLSGGIGYGRIRVSLVFRSAHMQMLPRELSWDTGVLEIAPEAFSADGLPKDVTGHRMKIHTDTSKARMHSSKTHDTDASAKWSTYRSQPLLLAVRKRYASNLTMEFKASSSGLLPKSKRVTAFCVAWLKDIPDEEWVNLPLAVYRDDGGLLQRAKLNVLPEEELRDARLGEVQIRVRFWRGLGTAHKTVAKRNPDVADVLEVRDAARELGNGPAMVGSKGWRQQRDAGSTAPDTAEEENSDSSDDDDDDDHADRDDKNQSKLNNMASKFKSSNKAADDASDDSDDGGHLNKMGAFAQRARAKIPYTKAHRDAKNEEQIDGEAAGPRGDATATGSSEPHANGMASKQTSSQARTGQTATRSDPEKREYSKLDTQNSQQAPSAPHASIGPTYGSDAVKNELHAIDSRNEHSPSSGKEPKSNQQSSRARPIEPTPSTNNPTNTALDTKKSQEAPSPVNVTKGPSQGSAAVRDSFNSASPPRAGSSDSSDANRSRTSTSRRASANYTVFPREYVRPPSATSTPSNSRPTTSGASGSNAPASPPQRSWQGPSTPKSPLSQTRNESTPSPEPSNKRRSGFFNSVRRNFSLKGSPDKEGRKDKRSSRFFSEGSARSGHTPSSSFGGSKASVAYDRSPLASHPTNSSTGNGSQTTPTKTHTPRRSVAGPSGSKHQSDDNTPLPSSDQGPSNTAASSDQGPSNTAPSNQGPANTAASPGSGGDGGDQTASNSKSNDSNSNTEQLHRRHRGFMQFQGPRTAKWLKHKAEGAIGGLEKGVNQEEREKAGGLETEV